ncbi:hypothetical protein ACQEVB_03695 [Pseudonocardia sp. CA-107938]|uniref:hypothetical protein n=1 Tax=Pseudonocardia sp. CA-107938 TaxID=3240021 RepID=UPI003D8D706D
MRTLLGAATALALAAALLGAGTADAAEPADTTWSADLGTAEAAGVTVTGGTARLAGAGAFRAPATEGAADGPLLPTGLLTFPARDLPAPTDQVQADLDGDPGGATVDVRGQRAGGGWTEWLPADAAGAVQLPQATDRVQARLVLTGGAAVRGVTLSARPAAQSVEGAADGPPRSYRVFATREGLVGGTTSNGHVITDRDVFVALPSRRALSTNGSSDYSVKVCAPNGRCAFAPVWDVGPWNTRDDYWNPADVREEWGDLPQGLPQSQAAYRDHYNEGKDQFGRDVLNPAGIDLADGVFWDALGLTDNSWVTVEYQWTGTSAQLTRVVSDVAAKVLAAPDAAARVVGLAAGKSTVPVQCRLTSAVGAFLQIGVNQFLDAAAVPDAAKVAPCPGAPAREAASRSPTKAPPG